MDYSSRWEIIKDIGQGGQGKVYEVLDKNRFHTKVNLQEMIQASIKKFSSIQTKKTKEEAFELFKVAVLQLIQIEDPIHHGALKILHEPKDARDFKRAEVRIKREIQAMSENQHPNLLKILEADDNSKWFVSQFHPRGTVDKNPKKFVGNFGKALRAFRPLVEGVSELHKKNLVHRDIKPQNVFLDLNDDLVLGDFGLVFFTDDLHTRISDIFENVGSRDWMPAWAMGMRVEDIKPSFDVFSLGKLLWSMLSGKLILRLWYFDRGEFNVEKMFPNNRLMSLANQLFRKCIVENEADCLPNAIVFLKEVDSFLSLMDNNADVIAPDIRRQCKVCGIGNYELIVEKGNRGHLEAFGLHPNVGAPFKIFACDYCGNIQLFDIEGPRGTSTPAWKQ